MTSFDEPDLISRLAKLPEPLRLAFAAACASRMARVYQACQDHLGLGVPAIVADALGCVWDFALGGPAADWADAEKDLVALIPDEATASGPAHFIMDDALASTVCAMRTATAFDPSDAVRSARRAYEAADLFAQQGVTAAIFDIDVERALLGNSTVQTELARQARDLGELEAASGDPVYAAIKATRLRAEIGGFDTGIRSRCVAVAPKLNVRSGSVLTVGIRSKSVRFERRRRVVTGRSANRHQADLPNVAGGWGISVSLRLALRPGILIDNSVAATPSLTDRLLRGLGLAS